MDYIQTKHLLGKLSAITAKGGIHTFIAQIIRLIVQLSSTAMLARLLTPSDYGLLAMVLSITGFAFIFKDLGLSMATVQSEDINEIHLNSMFWVNCIFGLIICAIIAALALPMKRLFNRDEILNIAIILSLTFIFYGLSVQHLALLKRQMRFGVLAIINVLSFTLSIIIAIVLAIFNFKYYSLVAMHLSLSIFTFILSWSFCSWRPQFSFNYKEIRDLLKFGYHLSAFNMLRYFGRNLDNILIGKFWGSIELGFYSKAYQILLLPINQINVPFSNVIVPALSRLQNDESEYKILFFKSLTIVIYITFPIILLLIVLSDHVISILLGNQWVDSIPIFRILAFSAFPQIILNTTGWVLISLSQTDRMLRMGIVTTVITIFGFFIGIFWGAVGIALSFTTLIYILFIPITIYSFKHSPISLSEIFHISWRPFFISIILIIGIKHFDSVFIGFSPMYIVLIKCIITLTIFTCVLYIWPTTRNHIYSILARN